MRLKHEKTEQTLEALAKLFGQSIEEANRSAESLVSIGLFQKRGSRDDPTFWVPFLIEMHLR